MSRREMCCENIVTINAESKTMKEEITNLKTLYTPVAQLKVLFIICIFVLGCVFTYMTYISTRVDVMRNDVTKILTTNELVKEDIKEIKLMFKEHNSLDIAK